MTKQTNNRRTRLSFMTAAVILVTCPSSSSCFTSTPKAPIHIRLSAPSEPGPWQPQADLGCSFQRGIRPCSALNLSFRRETDSTVPRSGIMKIFRRALASAAVAGLLSLIFLPRPAVASTLAAAAGGTEALSAAPIAATVAAAAPAAPTQAVASGALGAFRAMPARMEAELTFRLICAALFGGAVGLERSSSDRPAGIRTMALVSLGACAFTLCSAYGFVSACNAAAANSPVGAAIVKFDPSRMAANVASGVGFIGAGVITNNRVSGGVYDRKSSVNGLTTAAAIWVSAAIGVASGVGLYIVGGTAAISTITILRLGTMKTVGDRALKVASREGKKKRKSSSPTTPPKSAPPVSTSMPKTKARMAMESVPEEIENHDFINTDPRPRNSSASAYGSKSSTFQQSSDSLLDKYPISDVPLQNSDLSPFMSSSVQLPTADTASLPLLYSSLQVQPGTLTRSNNAAGMF